jgi:hypothetical protein
MADVYSQAHVVISADSANDARESIFTAKGQLTNKAISIPCSGPSKAKNIQVYARVVTQRKAGTRPPMLGDDVSDLGHSPYYMTTTKLDRRAWAFQERLLSPRTLHYTSDELVFECRENWRCECTLRKSCRTKYKLYKNQLPYQDDNLIAEGGSLLGWGSIVSRFTQRQITNDADRLPAISGVASTMKPSTPDDYLFGLWKPSLLSDMLWRTIGGKDSRRNHSQYAPSWSWASVTSRVELDELCEMPFFSEVLDIEAVKTTKNPYGPGTGTLTLRGPIIKSTVTVTVQELDYDVIHIGQNVMWPDVTCTGQMEITHDEEVYVFAIRWTKGSIYGNAYCIVLMHTNPTSSCFRRVGYVDIQTSDASEWTLETVKII